MHLALAVLHESLHGGSENSAEEELAANMLDTIAYANMLVIDPQIAFSGTELASFSNFQIYALLNSISTHNAGQLGIAVSVANDVFVGPGLEAYDAGSLRDAILEDDFLRLVTRRWKWWSAHHRISNGSVPRSRNPRSIPAIR